MLAAIIPAYNEEKTIQKVINIVLGSNVEPQNIFVINNNSTDKTKELALALGVNVINEKNSGYHYAINRGLREVELKGYGNFLIVDGDNEISEEAILSLIEVSEKYDFIFGFRNSPKRIGEKIVNYFFYKIYGIKDILCGLKYGRVDCINASAHLDYSIDSFKLEKLKQYNILNLPVHINLRDETRLGSDLHVNFHLIKVLVKYFFKIMYR